MGSFLVELLGKIVLFLLVFGFTSLMTLIPASHQVTCITAPCPPVSQYVSLAQVVQGLPPQVTYESSSLAVVLLLQLSLSFILYSFIAERLNQEVKRRR